MSFELSCIATPMLSEYVRFGEVPLPPPINVGTIVRLKDSVRQMIVTGVYFSPNDNWRKSRPRVKGQWVERELDNQLMVGFFDVDMSMVELVNTKTKTYDFKCSCEKQDPKDIEVNGLMVKCKKCGTEKTVQCIIMDAMNQKIIQQNEPINALRGEPK